MPIKLGENLVLYDIQELSEKLKVTPLTLRKYINGGRLKGQKLGNKWYVSESALIDFFNQYSKTKMSITGKSKRIILEGESVKCE